MFHTPKSVVLSGDELLSAWTFGLLGVAVEVQLVEIFQLWKRRIWPDEDDNIVLIFYEKCFTIKHH